MKKSIRAVTGFGLIEVLISSAILALVLGATIGLTNNSLRRAENSSSRAVAINLAQEAVELVRVARDSTYIDQLLISEQPNQWIDIFSSLPNNESDPLKLELTAIDGENFWRLTPGTENISINNQDFRRELYLTSAGIDYITLSRINIDPGAVSDRDLIRKLKVVVIWGGKASERVESIIYLTNWRYES